MSGERSLFKFFREHKERIDLAIDFALYSEAIGEIELNTTFDDTFLLKERT